MMGTGSWRPALRIARRDAAQHKLATTLAALMVALPVVGAVVASAVRSSGDLRSENGSYARMGGADAQLQVTAHTAVKVHYRDGGTWVVAKSSGGPDTPRRDPDTLDLPSLLPEGSRLVPDQPSAQVRLDAGGMVSVRVLDLEDPISRGLGALMAGSAPQASDEVAVSRTMAAALGLLDSAGDLRGDATLSVSGTQLHVVGLADTPDRGSVAIMVPPGSTLLEGWANNHWLVDLPELATGQLLNLREDLAASGVSVLFRDAAQHPEHWPELQQEAAAAQDPQALVLGAMIVGVGAVEVILLVGAALAVGARRQIRTLGLLASNGGAPRDARRVFLARGLLVGGGGSLAGAALGLGGLQLALPLWDGAHGAPLSVLDVLWSNIGDTPLYVLDAVWTHVAAIVLLGTLTGVLSAAYPAWVVGRMTAVDALAGCFPTGHRRATFRPVALGMVVTGLVGLVGAGFWTAAAFSPDPAVERPGADPSMLPVATGGLALLILVAGVVWMTPYIVDCAGRLSARLGLAGRIAVRDAARHRQRTTAAVVGLMVTIAVSVFAGFGIDAAVAKDTADGQGAQLETAAIFPGTTAPGDNSLARLRDTVERTIGADALVEVRDARVRLDRAATSLRLAGGGDVKVVGEEFLTLAGVDAAALTAYRDGAVLVTHGDDVSDGQVELEAIQHREPVLIRKLSATIVTTSFPEWATGAVWISPATAKRIGAQASGSTLLVDKSGGFDGDDAETLKVLGIDNDGMDTSGYEAGILTGAVIGGGLFITALAIGILVSLAAAEGRGDAATLAAVGAPPGRRRAMGMMQGLFVGVIGGGLGLVVGSAAGASLLQAVGTAGSPAPWGQLLVTVFAVPLMAGAVGWVATPSKVTLVRRLG